MITKPQPKSQPKAISLTKAKKKAWDAFSVLIRTRDTVRDKPLLDGLYDTSHALCITCDKPYPAFGKGCLQAGHFIPGRNNQILFDERQVFSQCYNCNVNLKGNWVAYLDKMTQLWGKEIVQDMLSLHRLTKKYSVVDYLDMEQDFKARTKAFNIST